MNRPTSRPNNHDYSYLTDLDPMAYKNDIVVTEEDMTYLFYEKLLADDVRKTYEKSLNK